MWDYSWTRVRLPSAPLTKKRLRIVWFQAFFIYYGLYSDRFNAQSSETTVQHGMGV